MIMDKGEICREYKAAKKRYQQIGILAELNCCSNDDIKFILLTNGEKVEGTRSASLIQRLKEAGFDKTGNKLIEITETSDDMPDEYDGVGEINVKDYQTHEPVRNGLPVEELQLQSEELHEVSEELHEVVIDIDPSELEAEEQPEEEKAEYHKTDNPFSGSSTLVTLTVPESIAKLLNDTIMYKLDSLEEEIKLHENYLVSIKKEYEELAHYLKKEAI